MDLLNITLYIGNIFLLFLFFLPGTILESMEQNDNSGSSRGRTRKSLQLDLKTKNSMETIASMSSTIAPLSYYHTTATNTILLTTSTSTAAATTQTITSTGPIKLLFSERKSKNDTKNDNSKQDNYYKRGKTQMMRRNLQVATDNNHEILNSNTITARKTQTAALPSTTSTTAKDAINEQHKQEQQTKKTTTTVYSSTHKYDPAQDHHHNNTNTAATYSTKSLSMQEIFANAKYTGVNIRNSLETTKYASNPFEPYHKDQQQQQQQQQGHVLQQQPITTITKTRSNSSTYELYTDNPDVSYKDSVFSIRERERNNYKRSGSDSTAPTATITINSFNKSKRPTAITTTKPTKVLTTKENRMYDNNSALTYLAYKSAALKASAVAFKTLNNNWNVFSNRADDDDDDGDGNGVGSVVGNGGYGIGIVGGNLKRDTLMSSAGMISTALAAVNDKNFMKNNTHTNEQQQHTYDDDDENTVKNALKTQHNFKSNNSLAHATLAIKQTLQTTPTTAIMKTKTKTTSTRLAINETSLTSSSASVSIATSSLPSNVSTTYSPKQTTAAIAATKEIPTTATSRTTLKATTKTAKRRKIATTTLKPPPTIDDYQTVTSQAGTHAYLPCNVKQLVKKPISWLRVRDGHILTVDQTTFIADQRFQSIFTSNPERWSLQIKYVQLKDAGIYECQVSTEPKASAIVYLHVVEPKTELIGAPTRHVKAGSQVKLLCIISQALEPPLFINWFYNQKQIYLHNRKGWHTEIERIELPPETTTTTTTTTTTRKTTTTTTPSTTATTGSTTAAYPSNAPLPTSTSMLNGSEIPAMHVFTSITPQQSLNDGNLLESVSESTYNNYYYPNLKQPEAAPILTTLKTQTTATSTTASSSSSAAPVSSESIAGLGAAHGVASSISTTTTTQPVALPGAETVETTTLSFNNDNDDKNNDDDDENDDDDADADADDYHTNPTVTTFETAEAIAAARGYMMLSSLMTVTDVKQITTASLIIPSVQKQDSGNYTCSPSNSEPRTVILHVLNGEYSASAITSTAGLNFRTLCFNTLLNNLLILILIHNIFNETIFNTLNIIRRYSGG